MLEAASTVGEDSQLQGRGRIRKDMTPEQYVDAIAYFAKQTTANCLYPGLVLEDLSICLQQIHESQVTNAKGIASRRESLAVLFNIQKDGLRRHPLSSISECVQTLHSSSEESQSQGHILLVNGYPCLKWIAHIGSLCHVDPWFFSSYLRFRCRRDYFSNPSPPSANRNIITLKIVTIGSRETRLGGAVDQASLDHLRADAAKAMQKYEQQMMVNGNFAPGDSIVRGFSILDKKHFIIEQEIAICLNRVGKEWLALICCDVGNDLSQGPEGPWLRERDRTSNIWTMFYPVIQQRRRIALKTRAGHADSTAQQTMFPQSAMLLAHDYGNLLDKKLMGLDPFYAMNELFRLFVFSTSQFLNIMEATINNETGHSAMSLEKPTLTNLLYCQRILESHLPSLQANIKVVRHHDSLGWPKVSEADRSLHSKAVEAAEELLHDMEYLEERTKELLERCKSGMSVLMNYVLLAESRQAMSQGQRVAKLTMLAFLYIPLSFTCGLFGMNVTEIVSGHLSVWVWVVTTIPVFLISVSFFYMDFTKVARWFKWGWKKLGLLLGW